MTRWVLLLLPIATVVVVGFALFVVGASRPYPAARLMGGPTDGVRSPSFRLSLHQRIWEAERPLPLDVRVTARRGDQRAEWAGRTSEEGLADLSLDFGAPRGGPLDVEIVAESASKDGNVLPGMVLAQGTVNLTAAAWRQKAERLGGWTRGSRRGDLVLRIAPERGQLAVPFENAVLVEVRDGSALLEEAEVSAELMGGTLKSTTAITNGSGRARLELTPNQHALDLTVRAKHGSKQGVWSGRLPVLPGAMDVTLEGQSLRVTSPIERDRAYVDIVTEQRRLHGAILQLQKTGEGESTATLPVPFLKGIDEPVWAVVSSEADLKSPAAVGWPIQNHPAGEPAPTFLVHEALVLDGTPQWHRKDTLRRRKAQLLAGLFTVSALVLAVALLFRRAKRSQQRLRAHLAAQAREMGDDAPLAVENKRDWLWLVVAVLSLTLGFAVVGLLSLFRVA